MNAILTWWKRRRLDRAQDLIQSYGLSVVKLKDVAGTRYLVNADGSFSKLAMPTRGAR